MVCDERRAFWAAIRANPDDDVVRLVYADWLDERGESDRAEFIRVQCAQAKIGPDRRKGRKDRAWLEPREQALLAAHRDAWLAPLREALKGSNSWDREDGWLDRQRFRRGFADAPHLGLESARRLAATGDTLEPVNTLGVMECQARYCHDSVVEVARWAGAGCVQDFSIAGGSDRDIAAVVESPSLRNLRYLGVWFGRVTDAGVARLAAWPLAGTLRSLDLKYNPITDAGAVALADSPYLGALRSLQLHDTRVTPAGLAKLRERFGDAGQASGSFDARARVANLGGNAGG